MINKEKKREGKRGDEEKFYDSASLDTFFSSSLFYPAILQSQSRSFLVEVESEISKEKKWIDGTAATAENRECFVVCRCHSLQKFNSDFLVFSPSIHSHSRFILFHPPHIIQCSSANCVCTATTLSISSSVPAICCLLNEMIQFSILTHKIYVECNFTPMLRSHGGMSSHTTTRMVANSFSKI